MYKIEDIINTIICGNAKEELQKIPSESINCIITSPPYWALRDYHLEPQIWDGDPNCKHKWQILPSVGNLRFRPGYNSLVGNNKNPAIYPIKHRPNETNPGKEGWYKDKGGLSSIPEQSNFCSKCSGWRGSLGLEPTFNLYIKHLCDIFDEIWRVLRKDGTCWVNLGDSYGGNQGRGIGKGNEYGQMVSHKQIDLSKSLCQIPSRFSIEMTNRGWILRNEIIWHKKNCMPSSVKDRFTVDFEKLFFFVKNKKYYFDKQYEPFDVTSNRWGGDIMKVPKNRKHQQGLSEALSSEERPWRNPQGRNKRCIFMGNTQYMRLKNDLTFATKQNIINELMKRDIL